MHHKGIVLASSFCKICNAVSINLVAEVNITLGTVNICISGTIDNAAYLMFTYKSIYLGRIAYIELKYRSALGNIGEYIVGFIFCELLKFRPKLSIGACNEDFLHD